MMEAPKILGVDAFQNLVGNFGAPWRPFWIFEVLIKGTIESKTYEKKFFRGSNNIGCDLFPDPKGHFGLSKAGGEVLQTL